MTKLSKSVNNSDDTKNEDINNTSFSLSKKIQKDAVEEQQNNLTENNTQLSVKAVNTTNASLNLNNAEEISKWLLKLIGNDVVSQIKENPYLQLPYTEPDIEISEWLSKAIKTIFSQQSIQNIGTSIQNNFARITELEQIVNEAETAKAQINDKVEKFNLKFREMQAQMDDVDGEKHALKKELNASIPITKFINEMFRESGAESENQKKLIETLNETLENTNDPNISTFVIRFAKGWIPVKNYLTNLGTDEKENLELIHGALSALLHHISGIFIPERRVLLDFAAKICSDSFKEYDFISPEQTLNVDPDIHNAQGVGNARIKEGVTFAVVRKETRKAVKYADIKV